MKNKIKYRQAKYIPILNRPDITPEIREEIVTECYKGESQADIAKRFRVTAGFVGFLKRKWDKENLYGQHTGENKYN